MWQIFIQCQWAIVCQQVYLTVNWFDLNLLMESGWGGTGAPQQFDLGNKVRFIIINHNAIYHRAATNNFSVIQLIYFSNRFVYKTSEITEKNDLYKWYLILRLKLSLPSYMAMKRIKSSHLGRWKQQMFDIFAWTKWLKQWTHCPNSCRLIFRRLID